MAHFVDGVLFSVLFVIAILVVGVLPSGTASDVVLWVVLVGGLTVGHIAYFVVLQKRGGERPARASWGFASSIHD